MPCPFFEPQRILGAANSSARLPLIHEYDGLCHALGQPTPAPEKARFRWCNHGNSKGCCQVFPAEEKRSSLRYDVVARDAITLRVLCIEEQSYAPVRWYSIQYVFGDERLDPEPDDICVRAQILSFCRSYLARFAAIEQSV